jgi:hypothetical protein
MKMNNSPKDKERFSKVSRIMEKVWLVVAIGSLLVVVYFFFDRGINRTTLSYLIFPALAGAMFGFRFAFRKRFEKGGD